MASKNVKNWEEPLPSKSTDDDEEDDEDEETPPDERMEKENKRKLEEYVSKMAYRPTPPPDFRKYLSKLAIPKKMVLIDNYEMFHKVMEPKLRAARLKSKIGNYHAISAERLEQIIHANKLKDRRKEDLVKRKHDIYYDMLTKLEHQCRSQYLDVLLKKFSNFIAHVALNMRIPPGLVEPYARMQRGIFCNILLAIGIKPTSQAAMYYATKEAQEYEVCHKLAHALLSLIIKALDAAATKNPDDMKPFENEFEMDNYIKDRLMCAAEKKIGKRCNKKK